MGAMASLCVALLLLPLLGHGATDTVSQENSVTLSMRNVTLKEVIWEIERQTGFVFAYNAADLAKAGKINVDVKDMSVEETLKSCLRHTGLTYVVQEGIIVIRMNGTRNGFPPT